MDLPPTPAQQLVIENIGLAYAQANHFARYKHLNWDDLFGEAQIALVEAANHYRPERGFAFSTFATRCIVRRLVEAIEREKSQKLPQDSTAWALTGDSAIDSVPDCRPELMSLEAEQIAHLKSLPPGTRFAVEMRLGLWDGREHRPTEIAFHLGLTVTHVMDLLSEGLDALLAARWD
jgi:RNA polymerase sigma factor (sigma-70 family)